MAFWHWPHLDKGFFQLLTPGLTSVPLLESESGFDIVMLLSDTWKRSPSHDHVYSLCCLWTMIHDGLLKLPKVSKKARLRWVLVLWSVDAVHVPTRQRPHYTTVPELRFRVEIERSDSFDAALFRPGFPVLPQSGSTRLYPRRTGVRATEK
jgi:hypothetical protein